MANVVLCAICSQDVRPHCATHANNAGGTSPLLQVYCSADDGHTSQVLARVQTLKCTQLHVTPVFPLLGPQATLQVW